MMFQEFLSFKHLYFINSIDVGAFFKWLTFWRADACLTLLYSNAVGKIWDEWQKETKNDKVSGFLLLDAFLFFIEDHSVTTHTKPQRRYRGWGGVGWRARGLTGFSFLYVFCVEYCFHIMFLCKTIKMISVALFYPQTSPLKYKWWNKSSSNVNYHQDSCAAVSHDSTMSG